MHGTASSGSLKSRELRTRVALPARMRIGCAWSDACILNVSSRGLLISASHLAVQDSAVELRHGDHVILARVVWRKGTQAGLRAEDRVPVEDIAIMSKAPPHRPVARPGADRRKARRSDEDSRLRSRAIEFAGIAFLAISLAATLFSMVEQAFARPLAMVSAALGG